MRASNQVKQLDKLGVNFIGFIHYSKSPRHLDIKTLKSLSFKTQAIKVLVTVNETTKKLLQLSKALNCKTLQLHGKETVQQCANLQKEGFCVIKAFAIDETFNFEALKVYKKHVDYFLFDYKGKDPGGNGLTFNWDLLSKYKLDTPYLLSGGISIEHSDTINKSNFKNCIGYDINSKFEISPSNKNMNLVVKFIKNINL